MNRTSTLVAGGVALALIGLAALLWRHEQPTAAPPGPEASAPAAAVAPASAAASAVAEAIRYPIQPPVGEAVDATSMDVDALLAELFGRKALLSMFQTQDFARRLVATVDNLGRAHASAGLWPVNPTGGRFTVEKHNGVEVISADNGLRYAPFVLLVETVDLRSAVAVYSRIYPLLQAAYEDLGYPKRYFNDRLVVVIDLLLATPDATEPLRVRLPVINGPVQPARPWVLYEFEDAELNALTAGQKILVRMGAVNVRRLKGKLIELRRLVTSAGLPR